MNWRRRFAGGLRALARWIDPNVYVVRPVMVWAREDVEDGIADVGPGDVVL